MHTRLAILTLSLLPTLAVAQQRTVGEPDPRVAQLHAATINGTASLRDQVLKTRVNHDLLVSDYLKSTNSLNELNRILESAKPVGGPRWIDDHTCQVRMELSASQVETLLMGIARRMVPNIHRLGLTCSGQNCRLGIGLNFRLWVQVPVGTRLNQPGRMMRLANGRKLPTRRRSAISQARADAAKHVMDEISPIVLQGQTHASEALARPAIADRLTNWLQQQPVTKIEFLDDLNVTVTMSVTPQSLAAAFKSAVENDSAFRPDAPIDWAHTSDEIVRLPDSISGTASALFLSAATTSTIGTLSTQPPDWVDQRLEADASASGGGSRLKTGRMAEAAAVGKIREQLLALRLNSGSNLGDAAKADPQINHAVDRAMLHAHTHQVDYHPDGSVKVRVSLDLEDAWEEMRSNP